MEENPKNVLLANESFLKPFKCLSKLWLMNPPPLTMLLRINTHSPHSYTSQLSKVFSVLLLKPDTTHTNIAKILCCNAIAGIHSRKYSKVVCYSDVICVRNCEKLSNSFLFRRLPKLCCGLCNLKTPYRG